MHGKSKHEVADVLFMSKRSVDRYIALGYCMYKELGNAMNLCLILNKYRYSQCTTHNRALWLVLGCTYPKLWDSVYINLQSTSNFPKVSWGSRISCTSFDNNWMGYVQTLEYVAYYTSSCFKAHIIMSMPQKLWYYSRTSIIRTPLFLSHAG